MPKKRTSLLWSTALSRSLTRTVSRTLARSVRVGLKAVAKSQAMPRRPSPVKKARTTGPRPTSARPPAPGAWTSGHAVGPAGTRRYQLFKPPGVPAGERLPLVVMLHGCGQDADAFALSTRMNRLAIPGRFLVLYPEQDRRINLQRCWNWYDTDSRRAYREAATLVAAIDQVCLRYPVDADRIGVAGLSAGASMAALLASRYPARFCAVVMHSGIPPGAAHSTASALAAMLGRNTPMALDAATRWPPLLVIHGSADTVVAPSNGEAAAGLWAQAAGAKRSPGRTVQRGQRREMTLTDFTRQRKVVATLCVINGLGHAWSGGTKGRPYCDASGPDASRMVWAFMAKQFGAQQVPALAGTGA